MIELNLEAKTKEHKLIKAYLEENASETLAEKINNGVSVEKDGKALISKKNLDGFMNFACDEARKLAEKGARGVCIEKQTIFGWAIHYFEEDGIEGTLYNADGTEYKTKPKYEPKANPAPVTVKKTEEKPQMSLFDLVDINDKSDENEQEQSTDVSDDESPITEEEMQEVMREFAAEDAKLYEAPSAEKYQGSPLYQRYMNIQTKYPDAIIALRLGDFYEVFGENAVNLANELNLTLTGRDCGLDERVPIVGFPYHAADMYFRKICSNHKLVIVESTGETRLLEITESGIGDTVDLETGEILTQAEMRKFDGDIEEPKNLQTAADDALVYERNIAVSFDSATVSKLSYILGDIFIVR